MAHDSKPALYPELLEEAYCQGFFPMPDPKTGKIQFLRPDPRAVFPLDGFHTSRSLRRTLNRGIYEISFDQNFPDIMNGCANREETWITEEFFLGYQWLHQLGKAHSVEVWEKQALVGGAYGVSFGAAFFAESMFHTKTDASKVGLYYLVEHLRSCGFVLLEVQFLTPHLESLGAIEISDSDYQKCLKAALKKQASFEKKECFLPTSYLRQ